MDSGMWERAYGLPRLYTWGMPSSWSSWISVVVASCLLPLLYTILNTQMHSLMQRLQEHVLESLNSYEYVYVYDTDGWARNELYHYVRLYLNSKAESVAGDLNATMVKPLEDVVFAVEQEQRIFDKYEEMDVMWEHGGGDVDKSTARSRHPRYNNAEGSDGKVVKRSFYRMRFCKKTRSLQHKYLMHIAKCAKEMESERRKRFLYTNNVGGWSNIPLQHPFTFDSLALESAEKMHIINDLKEFIKGREYYKKVGKPWKRGYLLYGPPGTGKSSLIAAIANFLRYDVYDLELSNVVNNGELRRLLTRTTAKSIIVIEDIDCTINLSNRVKKKSSEKGDKGGVTLSGILNFSDGLWSACGNERLFIFTTNHAEKLDPALLRKGRMDLHICMSYCTFGAFKVLMRNYLNIQDHELLPEIEKLLESTHATPAGITEVLLTSKADPTAALQNVIEQLKTKALELPDYTENAVEDLDDDEEEDDEAHAQEARTPVYYTDDDS